MVIVVRALTPQKFFVNVLWDLDGIRLICLDCIHLHILWEND